MRQETPKWSKSHVDADYTKSQKQQKGYLRCEFHQKRIDQPNKQGKSFGFKILEESK